MDYDQTSIPAGYDRARDHGPEFLDLWMNVLGSLLADATVGRILDLGCGTGRFSEPLAARFRAELVGLDPSRKMLEVARRKRRLDRVHYQRGSAEAIPLARASVDVVFMSMCFHHFPDRLGAARECRRVLREGGTALLRTGTRERIGSFAYLPFFPSARPLLEQVLPALATLREVFEAAGFRLAASPIVTQTIAPDWTAYADKLAAGGDSILARLSEEELRGGLAALRQRAIDGEHSPIVEPIDLLVFR